jgi:hypothetical protein
VGTERVHQRCADGKPAKSLNSSFALLKVEGTGTKIPMQKLPAPDMEIQSLLSQGRGRQNMGPERGIERAPEVVGTQAVLNAMGFACHLGVSKGHSGMTAQMKAIRSRLVDLMTTVT